MLQLCRLRRSGGGSLMRMSECAIMMSCHLSHEEYLWPNTLASSHALTAEAHNFCQSYGLVPTFHPGTSHANLSFRPHLSCYILKSTLLPLLPSISPLPQILQTKTIKQAKMMRTQIVSSSLVGIKPPLQDATPLLTAPRDFQEKKGSSSRAVHVEN